jgi:hypothetical protein
MSAYGCHRALLTSKREVTGMHNSTTQLRVIESTEDMLLPKLKTNFCAAPKAELLVGHRVGQLDAIAGDLHGILNPPVTGTEARDALGLANF